jgi:hypothetical protein
MRPKMRIRGIKPATGMLLGKKGERYGGELAFAVGP